jgi:hypothetical protein
MDLGASTAPIITLQPISVSGFDGGAVSFSVSAAGATGYQWQRQANGIGGWSDIGGATTANYTTGILTKAGNDLDNYRCNVTNAQGTVTSNAASLAVNFLLDVYTTAALALCMRRIRNAYAGSPLRVRRTNDNAEADIGLSGSLINTAAITAHVSSHSGFVTAWRDQSVAGTNFSQATTASQPRIVNAGAIDNAGGKTGVLFVTGGNRWMTGSFAFSNVTGFTAFLVYRPQAASKVQFGQPSGAFQVAGVYVQDRTLILNRAGALDTCATTALEVVGTTHQHAFRFNPNGVVDVWRNGGSQVTASGLTFTNSAGTMVLGGYTSAFNSNNHDGHLLELIIFPSALSDTDVAAISENQVAFYGAA